MKSRYLLAPEAAADLVEIWQYIKEQASSAVADRIESAIRERIAFLGKDTGGGAPSEGLDDGEEYPD